MAMLNNQMVSLKHIEHKSANANPWHAVAKKNLCIILIILHHVDEWCFIMFHHCHWHIKTSSYLHDFFTEIREPTDVLIWDRLSVVSVTHRSCLDNPNDPTDGVALDVKGWDLFGRWDPALLIYACWFVPETINEQSIYWLVLETYTYH